MANFTYCGRFSISYCNVDMKIQALYGLNNVHDMDKIKEKNFF